MNMIHFSLMMFAGFLISISVSVMLEVPRNLILKNGFIGILAEIVYELAIVHNTVPVSVFLACLAVTLVSHVFARKFKAPVTVFCIPVFFIFVPGTAIYQMTFYVIQANPDMATKALFDLLNIAGAVALGVFLSDSLVHIFYTVKYKLAANKGV